MYKNLSEIKLNSLAKNIQNELIYGSHLIALTGPAFVLSAIILLDLEVNWLSMIIAYIIPFIVYSFNYQSELSTDKNTNPEKVEYLEKRKNIFPWLIISYIILSILILLHLRNSNFDIFILILLTGGILYTLIFKVLTSIVPGFKSLYTALVWAYHGTFFVIFFYSLKFQVTFIVIFTYIFLKSIINVVFFDIKDIDTDKKENLKTFPIILGKNNTVNLLMVLNVLTVLIVIAGIYFQALPVYALVLILLFPYTAYYLLKGKNAEKNTLFKYTYIVADAEFLLWPVLLIIGKYTYLCIVF